MLYSTLASYVCRTNDNNIGIYCFTTFNPNSESSCNKNAAVIVRSHLQSWFVYLFTVDGPSCLET